MTHNSRRNPTLSRGQGFCSSVELARADGGMYSSLPTTGTLGDVRALASCPRSPGRFVGSVTTASVSPLSNPSAKFAASNPGAAVNNSRHSSRSIASFLFLRVRFLFVRMMYLPFWFGEAWSVVPYIGRYPGRHGIFHRNPNFFGPVWWSSDFYAERNYTILAVRAWPAAANYTSIESMRQVPDGA